MRSVLLLAALATAGALAATSVAAQGPARSIGVSVGHSMTSGSSAHAPLCVCPNADVLAPVSVSSLEFDVAWRLAGGSRWGLEYPLRVVPLALVRNNPTDAAQRGSTGQGWTISAMPLRASTFGFGVKPAGLRGWLGSPLIALQADASGGFMHFGTPLFAANGARFNFVAELGVGVRIEVPGAGRTVIGYRWHHLSNGGLAEVNPGLNSDMLTVGFWLE